MYDIVIRYCGNGEFLPIIKTELGELYRGSRVKSAEEAFAKAVEVFERSATGNIIEFKRKNGL